MDWQKMIVQRTMEGAGENTDLQLEFLLRRLEACPEALPAIADAIFDMAQWTENQGTALHRELERRQAIQRDGGAEIVTIDPR
jgi:hypothetical protein